MLKRIEKQQGIYVLDVEDMLIRGKLKVQVNG
jgi:hypothetical protein